MKRVVCRRYAKALLYLIDRLLIHVVVEFINVDCSIIFEHYCSRIIEQLVLMSRIYEHPSLEEISLSRVLFALSDPIRLEMVRILAKDGTSNSLDLGQGMPKSTITHHTRILRESGVTYTRPEGRNCWISLRSDDLEKKYPGLLTVIVEDKDNV